MNREHTSANQTRADMIVRVIAGLFFVAFALYCGFNVYHSLENPFRTVRAATVTLVESVEARGYVVREEQVISGRAGIVTPELGEGEKAGLGHVVAIGYSDGADSRAVMELSEAKLRLEQLRAAATISPEERERRSEAAIAELAGALNRRELESSAELVISAESLIMSGSEPEYVAGEITALENQIALMTAQIPQGTPITAPVSGVFSIHTDGFENITPGDIFSSSPADLDAAFAFPTGELGVGKLVTGTKWYLALVVDSDSGSRLVGARTVTVRLTRPVQAEYSMTVEEVGRNVDGERTVILSCSWSIPDVISARAVSAEIIYGKADGIRVPKTAIRLEEDPKSSTPNGLGQFVYIIEGARAKRVRVEIISEFGEAYIVHGENPDAENRPEAASPLRDGSEIIVKANDLYDNKVIR